MTETKISLWEKLANIQAELKAPKNQYNSFAKYKYRNAEDIEEGVKPLCVKHRATLIVRSVKTSVFGNGLMTKVLVELHDWDSDQVIRVTGRAREEVSKKGNDASQVSGGAQSYATKYALSQMFLVDDSKDSDSDADYQARNQQGKKQPAKPAPQQAAPAPTPDGKTIDAPTAKRYQNAIAEISAAKGSQDGKIAKWFLDHLGVGHYNQITESQIATADSLIAKLKEG